MEIKKNWKLNDTVKPEDLNRIETNIEELQKGNSIETLDEHKSFVVTSEEGVHGLRYYEEKLQVRNPIDGAWTDANAVGNGIAPGNVSNIKIKKGDNKLSITWNDPNNTIVNGHTICKWAGTKLVLKEGAYPENVHDGILLVDNKVRNKYGGGRVGYTCENLKKNTIYYFMLFPYSDKNVINIDINNRIEAMATEYTTYGVEIDLNNSNPDTWAQYTDDAVGMNPGSNDFDLCSIFDIQSYTFLNGKEVKALSKTNNRQYADGGNAQNDLTSGVYDIMTKFQRGGYLIQTIGRKLIVKVTNEPNKSGFCYKAFQKRGIDKPAFYLGRYKACEINGKLRSVSSKNITYGKSKKDYRALAHANGDGYEQSSYYQLVWRQCLYIIKYLAKNSRNIFGEGERGLGGRTGRNDGLGDETRYNGVTLFGIEDFWSGTAEFIEGVIVRGFSEEGRKIYVSDRYLDGDIHEGGIPVVSLYGRSNKNLYISEVIGNNDGAFLYKEAGGSETTFFHTKVTFYQSGDGCLGGNNNNSNNSSSSDSSPGIFGLSITFGYNAGARLMYL